ncbi:hypothetical protein BASA83_011855 [Batrachochytrium salamandrivorans]|nr:hypothetical protein BASA83_011855 [Batrachochytrium salamandrivorans]
MPRILDALNEKGAKASFFVNGLNDGNLHDPVSKDLGDFKMTTWGYKVVEANFDPKDYAHDSDEDFVDRMHEEYSKRIPARNGQSHIVVHHQFVGGNADWVHVLLDKYQVQLGYKFVTIGECLGVPKHQWYHNTQPHL